MPQPTDLISLRAPELTAELTGGDQLSVSSLRWHGRELLLEPDELTVDYRIHGRRAGITLLHPWANRLSRDTYDYHGITGRLDGASARVSRDANGLAIHGLRAPVAWTLAARGDTVAEATLDWSEEAAFPFPHRVVVTLGLQADALEVTTTVSAEGGGPVPVALGWHPYFRANRAAPTVLELPAMTALRADERGIPTGATAPEPARRWALGETDHLDDGFADLAAGARMAMELPDRRIEVEWGPGYGYGQVFAPLDAPDVSLEPMTAPTDALGHADRLGVATPDQPYVASFRLTVSAPADPEARGG